MPQSFPTSVGTVEVVVHEASRIVSISRLGPDGRPFASRMCDWDTSDLTQVLTEVTVPFGEAKQIADQVEAEYASLNRPVPEPAAPTGLYQAGYRSLELEHAGVALRFVAVLLDSILVFLPLGIIVGLMSGGGYVERGSTYTNAGVDVTGNTMLFIIFLVISYYVFAEGLTGMTLGKRLVGIRVVDEAGQHLGMGAAVVRNLLRLVDGILFYLVGALFAFSSPKGQRIGDRAAHTVVIRR
jgi:uncharacterized RDD family membrane protein YckC